MIPEQLSLLGQPKRRTRWDTSLEHIEPGQYEGTIRAVGVFRSKRDERWRLRVECEVWNGYRSLRIAETRKLAPAECDDAAELTRAQLAGWDEFCRRLGVPASDVRNQLAVISLMRGEPVFVRVPAGPHVRCQVFCFNPETGELAA